MQVAGLEGCVYIVSGPLWLPGKSEVSSFVPPEPPLWRCFWLVPRPRNNGTKWPWIETSETRAKINLSFELFTSGVTATQSWQHKSDYQFYLFLFGLCCYLLLSAFYILDIFPVCPLFEELLLPPLDHTSTTFTSYVFLSALSAGSYWHFSALLWSYPYG